MVLTRPAVTLPAASVSPGRRLLVRMAAATALVAFVTLVAFFGREGYHDAAGGTISLLDALYYATVSITTTGYGDITPITEGSRLATTLLITPARIVFLIILVGTTIEVLTESTRLAVRERLWRQRLKDHTIVCGFGTKGRAAIATLLAAGTQPDQILVIDVDRDAIEEATRGGFAAIHGSASRATVLEEAEVERASAVIVASDRDDSAVLVTLTARELNPAATIVASAREAENVHLLRQSGADSVILSSGAAGQLLGQAVNSPQVVAVLEDLLAVGEGLDIIEREVTPPEVGQALPELSNEDPVIAVIRREKIIRFDDGRLASLEAGDRLICLCSRPDG
jgi:voltage-gated potassium channel